ncbi:hypothetical protein AG4045_004171, partial [Apium graveolens]
MSILERVNCYDMLMSVKKICKLWHRLCKDPHIWRVVKILRDVLSEKLKENKADPVDHEVINKVLEKMAMHVIDLSCGQLLDLSIQGFGYDYLLQYIYQ